MFLGLGLIVASISAALQHQFWAALGSPAPPSSSLSASPSSSPGPPVTARLFPLFTVGGLAILFVALVLAVVQGLIASGYWDHSIATELNPAAPGDSLLSTRGTLESMDRWLEPVKFVGLGLLFTGVGLAAASVIWVMRFQSRRLLDILAGRP